MLFINLFYLVDCMFNERRKTDEEEEEGVLTPFLFYFILVVSI